MNAATLEALKGSIRKWEGIAEGEGTDGGWNDCPLCIMFIDGEPEPCAGCPVYVKTGVGGCGETPHEMWKSNTKLVLGGRQAKTPLQKAQAQAELNFLKSLLPEGDHD